YWNSSGQWVASASSITDSVSGNLGRTAGEIVSTYNYNLGNVVVSAPSNYTTNLTAGTFAITPRTLTITADAGQSKVYGNSDSASGFGYSSTGLVIGVTPRYWNSSGQLVNAASSITDSVSGNLGRTAGEIVSTYNYNLGNVAASAPNNYSTSLTAGTFAITPRALTITADAGQSKIYGNSDSASGFGYSSTGLVIGVTPKYWNSSGQWVASASSITDSVNGQLGRTAGEIVSTYNYNLGNVVVSAPSNYTTNLTAGTFAITPRTLTITADAGQSKVYGNSDSASGFGYSSTGLVIGVTPRYWNSSGQLVNAASSITDSVSGNLGRTAGEIVSTYNYNLGNVAASAPNNYSTSLTA